MVLLQITPRFCDFLGGLIGLRVQLYPELVYHDLLQREDTQQSQHREKYTRVRFWGRQAQAPTNPSQWSRAGVLLPRPQQQAVVHVKWCLTGDTISDLVPRRLLGARHGVIFCLTCTKFPRSCGGLTVEHKPSCFGLVSRA